MLHLATGQTVGGYQVTGFLGRGAFALVYAAEGTNGDRVAIKIGDSSGGGRFLPRFAEVTAERDPERISPDETPAEALFLDPERGARPEVVGPSEVDQMILAEGRLLAAAESPTVVRLHETLEVDGRPALVLDLLSGSTLRERMRSLEGVKMRWILDAVKAVETQIERGHWTCHGDIKPENLFVTDADEIRLLDPVAPCERPDMVVATPHYNPFLRQDAKGDAQATAILIYELLCSCLPFRQVPWPQARIESSVAPEDLALSRSWYLGYPRPRDLNPRAPKELERVVYRALCDDDYGLRELREDLESFLMI